MAKKAETIEDLFKQEIALNEEDCKKCNELFSQGWIKYLSERIPQIIRLEPDGNFTVLRYDGVIGKKVAEFPKFTYDTDIPYSTWNQIISEWEKWKSKQNFIRKKEVEHLEELAKTLNYEQGNPEF